MLKNYYLPLNSQPNSGLPFFRTATLQRKPYFLLLPHEPARLQQLLNSQSSILRPLLHCDVAPFRNLSPAAGPSTALTSHPPRHISLIRSRVRAQTATRSSTHLSPAPTTNWLTRPFSFHFKNASTPSPPVFCTCRCSMPVVQKG